MSSGHPVVGGGAAGKATSSPVVAGNRNWDGPGRMDQINVVRVDDTHIAEEQSDVGGKVKGEAADYYEVEYSIPAEDVEEEEEEEDSVYVIEYSNPEEEGDSYQFTMSVDRSLSAKRPLRPPVVKGNAMAPSPVTSKTPTPSRLRQAVKRKMRTDEGVKEEGTLSNKSVLELGESYSDLMESGKEQLVCTLCPPPAKFFKRASGLAVHLKKTHLMEGKKMYFCTSCKQTLRSQIEFDAHTRRHANQGAVFTCVLCPAETTRYKGSKLGLKRHLKKEHPGVVPRCNICNRGFKTIMTYLDDQFRHVGVSPFYCAQCQIYEMTERGLSVHNRNHDKKKQQLQETTDKHLPALEDFTNTDNSATDDSDF
ncbi:myoneurin isoform X2 [Paralichthys olivaceus]